MPYSDGPVPRSTAALSSGFASNGSCIHSPGAFSLGSVLVAEASRLPGRELDEDVRP